MTQSSKTLIQIQDETQIAVGVNADRQLYVRIGADNEHQVEIQASAYTMAGLAALVSDRVVGHVAELERKIGAVEAELERWVKTG